MSAARIPERLEGSLNFTLEKVAKNNFSFSTGNTSKPKSEFTTCFTGCASVLEAFFLMKSRFFKVRLASPELRVRDSSGGSGDAMRGHFCNGSISVRQELRRPRGVGRPR